MVALTLAAELLILILIGVFMRKRHIVDDEFSSRMTDFLFSIPMPCLIFNAIRGGVEFSVQALISCAAAAILGTVAIGLSLLIGQISYILGKKTGRARIMRYCLTFCHFSFMGIPVVDGLFGETGTLYYAFFLISVRIAYYTLSSKMLTPPDVEHHRQSFRELLQGVLLNPCLVAVALGLIFWMARIPIPEPINYCIKQLAAICSPMGLLMCGMTLGKYNFSKLLAPHYLKIPLARCVMMPLIFLPVSRLLMLWGIEPMLCNILVIYASLPTASFTAVYTLRYDPDENDQYEAVGATVISAFLSAFTIPLWYSLLV